MSNNNNNNNIDMERLELLLREHFAKTEKQLADIRADNAEFRTQMKDEMSTFKDEIRIDLSTFKDEIRMDLSTFKDEVRADLQNVRSEMNSRFDNVQAQISVMQNDITGLKHDVASLFHWNYWILAIIIGFFVLPNCGEYLRGLFGAVRDGIAGIVALFRGKSNNA